MPRYVALMSWTDQGVRNAKDTVRRYEEARAALDAMGVKIETIFWTQGRYDIVSVAEAPDDETLATALLRLAGQGNLRSETMRAFTVEEMGRIAEKLG
jgi:uncharacterized protein with GYD domain